MASKWIFLMLCVIAQALAETPIKVEPKEIDEFVFIQTSSSGARPIARKEKPSSDDRAFETSHKFPPYVTYVLNDNETDDTDLKSIKKREVSSNAPAPPGSIKLDARALLEKYKSELVTSSTTPPTTPKKRTKKEVTPKPTPHPRPMLTSRAPATPRSLHVKEGSVLATSESEKQRSRIQIKKGPNGQEYEYEYVYYYYDDDDDKEPTEKVHNSHDGPARDEKRKTHYNKESAFNEVIPTNRGRSRGRQLEDEDVVGEDRLPPSTRFPPRSRNFATTLAPEDETKPSTKTRTRGKPATPIPTVSNDSEETQGSRGRTRNNVRRPSLDLVDNASFNTNSGASEPPTGGPSFPSDLPSGPVRFLGATPNERILLNNKDDRTSYEDTYESNPTTTGVADITTMTISPMDKVALDLYAILQGTQKLSGDEDTDGSVATTDIGDGTTAQGTTDVQTTEIQTTTTTTTTTTSTTTTTTPAPTTTSETPAPGRGRFRGGSNKRRPAVSSTAPPVEATPETKPKNRFGRPSFNRQRPSPSKNTTEPDTEANVVKEEIKPVSRVKPTVRSRFSGTRNRPTTEAADDHAHDETPSTTTRASISRPRPGFNLRTRGRSTTSAPTEESSHPGDEVHAEENAISTPKPRGRVPSVNNNIRPLRPGPKLNISRTRTSTTTAAPEVSPEESEGSEIQKEDPPTTTPAVEDKNPLSRLRNRQRLNPVPRQKPAASSPVQVRRVNPLISRRKPGTTEPSSTEAPVQPNLTENEDLVDEEEIKTEAPSSTTTEEPKGLNKLLAGRRRLATRHQN